MRWLLTTALLLPGLVSGQDDWAGLGRFAEANAALGAPGPDEQRVVFLGDSITQGWPDASPAYFSNPAYVARGISAQTTPQMLARFRADVVALEPAAVVILAGTNDIAGNSGPASNEMIQGNLASMSEIATANGIRVVLASILPARDYPWRPGQEPAPRIREINEWIAQYVDENDHIYLDFYSAMVDEQGGLRAPLTTDGVHLTAAGYAVMEPLAEAAIDEALSRPRNEPGSLGFRPIDGCARTTGNRRRMDCD